MPRLHLIALWVCCTARAWAADLLPGETLGGDLLGPSGLATALAEKRSPFADDPGAGGDAHIEAGAEGPRIVAEDTTGGTATNAASSLRWHLGPDTPAVARINALLARPVAEPPVSMLVSCRVQRLAAASRLIGCSLGAAFTGATRIAPRLFIGSTDFRRLSGYSAGGPAALFDERSCSALRVQIPATGGAAHIDGLTFSLDLRVDTGSTPERLALDHLAVQEIAGPALVGAAGTVACIGCAPPIPLLAAARRAGWRVLPASEDAGVTADLLIVQRRLDDEKAPAALIQALDAGRTVLVSLNAADKPVRALDDRLPANAWSWSTPNLQRGPATATAVPGSGWSGTVSVSHRFDLHLPGSPLENGLMRYEWPQYGKGPLVSDWQAPIRCEIEGCLPLLVTGRSGAGRAGVLAADVTDPELTASPDFASWCDALLAWAKPQAPAAADPAASSLVLEVLPHQPKGLSVGVRNPGAVAAGAVLSWKTSSWGREQLVARSQSVQVPPGGSIQVALADDTPADALPWRRVDVALLSADRRTVLARRTQAVSVAPLVQLAVTEDPSGDPVPAEQARAHNEAEWSDGRMARRYIHTSGTSVHLDLAVSNGRLDLAPLATARDLGYPDNPSTGGLNDLSWSLSNVRGAGPWQGGWSGRPASVQRLELAWPFPVTVVGQVLHGYGSYRHWSAANPSRFQVLGRAGGTEHGMATVDPAQFLVRSGDTHAYCEQEFAKATTVEACILQMEGLDPAANREPHHITPSNCSVQEWEVLGWTGTAPQPAAEELIATAVDLLSGERSELLRERLTIGPGTVMHRPLALPAHPGFGPVRIEIAFGAAHATHDVLYVPAGIGLHEKGSLADLEVGLLCSPGWTQTVGFGLGMRSQTQGWGGDDDKIWALEHNLTETGANARDAANRLFTTDARFSHYTNPWLDTPGGWNGWDLAAAGILERAEREKKQRVHVVGADRWNGIPVNACWSWSTFIAFDQHLRTQGGPGLQGRSRTAVAQDILAHHGDAWQRWNMARYADTLLTTQRLFASKGHVFSFETHGSFPLAGGDLGAAIAQTHRSVGTDLFWELRNQDVYGTLGNRFGLVAANPSLASGAYGQWGYDNSDCNQWWFATNGGADPGRRQWYATYFAGRIALNGSYAPYHMTGFTMEAEVGTQVYPDDMAACVRTTELASRIRPEAAAGCTIVLSWAEQDRHMGPLIGKQGFGLYAGSGHEQVDTLFADTYERLVKSGLPIGTVTAAEALAHWQGTQPLVLVDGFAWSAAQLDEVARLNRAGAPVLVIGSDEEAQGDAAATLCGVRREGSRWTTAASCERIDVPGGMLFIRSGPAPVAWCPVAPADLSAVTARALVTAFLKRCGDPLSLPPGVACTPMISQGRLWLPLCALGDDPGICAITIRPEWFAAGLAGDVRVIDLDRGLRLATHRSADGHIAVDIPMPGCGGRMLLIDGGKGNP